MTVLTHLLAVPLSENCYESLVLLQNKYGKAEAYRQIEELVKEGRVEIHKGMNSKIVKFIK